MAKCSISKLRFVFILCCILSFCLFVVHFHFLPSSDGHVGDPEMHSGIQRPGWSYRVRSSAAPRSSSGQTVLVTGAAGFIGYHISSALKNRGEGVVGLDNFNNRYEVSLKRDRQAMLERSGVFVLDGDINDEELLRKLFKTVNFTHVFHLAALSGSDYSRENPTAFTDNNISGFLTLLEVCKDTKPKPRITFSSSASVYGLNSQVPFSESDRTDEPASYYAATKKVGEAMAHSYYSLHNLSITVLRMSTVYGPWGRPDMAYFSLTDILQGKWVPELDDEEDMGSTGDLTYIEDVLKACIAAMDTAKRSGGRGAEFRIYNIGNTKAVKREKVVGILEKLLEVKVERVAGDVKCRHVNNVNVNITLAGKELGYEPTTDLESGLQKFVKWHLAYYKREK